jgi:hypothetical protein
MVWRTASGVQQKSEKVFADVWHSCLIETRTNALQQSFSSQVQRNTVLNPSSFHTVIFQSGLSYDALHILRAGHVLL